MTLFNSAYAHDLTDSSGRKLATLSFTPENERPDVVAEYAFRLSKIAHANSIPLSEAPAIASLRTSAAAEALRLIQLYERKQSPPEPLTATEQQEGHALLKRYEALSGHFSADPRLVFCPQIPGAGFIDSCEGDLSIGRCLIEVKTTLRKPLSKDVRQLLIYLALDANAGTYLWKEFGLFNPRRGTIHRIDVESFILNISGGRPPRDIYSDIIAFTESTDMIIDRKF